MSDERRAPQVDWNLPPGPTVTRCPECAGEGAVMVERRYAARDEVGTLHVPAQCRGCRGTGTFPGMRPPA